MLLCTVALLWLGARLVAITWDVPPPTHLPRPVIRLPIVTVPDRPAPDNSLFNPSPIAAMQQPSILAPSPPAFAPAAPPVFTGPSIIGPAILTPTAGPSHYQQLQMLMLAMHTAPARSATMRHGFAGHSDGGMMPTGYGRGLTLPRGTTGDRWTGAAWAMVRGGGLPAVARTAGGGTGGGGGAGASLGGSQAGARIALRLDQSGRAQAYARLVTAGRLTASAEAALGASWQPHADVPLRLAIERRQGIAGSDARSAFAAYVSGGVNDRALPAGWRLNAYGAAGVVGARRRDGFAEAAVAVTHPLASIGALRLSGGAGGWAAAQPGASRVDVGPTITARLDPVASHPVAPRLSLDWRQRVAGQAAPASGVALTLAADF